MNTLKRILVILSVIAVAAAAIYWAVNLAQPALSSAILTEQGRGEPFRGSFLEALEDDEAHDRRSDFSDFRRQRRFDKASAALFDRHFDPLRGTVGMARDVAIVGVVVAGVIAADRLRARSQPR